MTAEYKRQTEQTHNIDLTSSILLFHWKKKEAPVGHEVKFELETDKVTDNSVVTFIITDASGKVNETKTEKIRKNKYEGRFKIPEEAEDKLTITAKIEEYGLEAKTKDLLVLRSIEIRIGDEYQDKLDSHKTYNELKFAIITDTEQTKEGESLENTIKLDGVHYKEKFQLELQPKSGSETATDKQSKQKILIDFHKDDIVCNDEGEKYFEIQTKGSDALILHPSFCCPVIVEEGKPINIFILAGDDFYKAFSAEVTAEPNPLFNDNENTPQIKICNVVSGVYGGGMIKRHINQMLKLAPWDKIESYGHMQDDPIKPMYISGKKAEENISVTYLDEISKPTGLTDKDGMIFANMRGSSFNKYVKDEGLKYLFQIELANIDHIKKGMYDFSWITYNDNVFDNFSEKEIEDKTDCREFYEKQDQITRKYICEDEKRKGLTHAYKVDDKDNDFKFETDEETPIQNHHPVYIVKAGKKKLNIGHLSDVHVSSRQFAFQTCKAKVIPGCKDSPEIGSMVNVTFYTLRDLMDEMAKDTDILIFTGDLIDYGRNYNPKSKFIGNDAATTGDIWDQMTLDNIDKKFEDGDDAGKDMYPHSIDNVLIYSLFRRHYKKHGKPILLVSGNHECYTVPYGISPRVDFSVGAGSTVAPYSNMLGGLIAGALKEDSFWGKMSNIYNGAVDGYFNNDKDEFDIKEIIRKANEVRQEDWSNRAGNKEKEGKDKNIDAIKANEGIPADHNLTIYEAILMYGPDYNMVPMSGFTDNDSSKNFKSENLDWFYNIFTPLEDFAISYNNKQHFIGLGWGEKERFISIANMGIYTSPHLPRAPEAVTDKQLELIKSAINTGKGDNILLSHFTFVNYDSPKGIESKGEINYNNKVYKEQTDSCSGTFESNRYEVYKMLLDGQSIKYTLSGHSHRNGVYICTDKDSSWMPGRYDFETEALPMDMTTKEYNKTTCGTKMIVSSSGGPNGKQNFNNELFNWSIDYPSGTYIKYDDNDKETIGIIRSENEKAKPRFAVALEYADIVGRNQLKKDSGIFNYIKLAGDGSTIELEVNPELNIPINGDGFIQQISLYINKGQNTKYKYQFEIKSTNNSNSILSVLDVDLEDLKRTFANKIEDAGENEFDIFLSIKLKCLSNPYFEYYDFSKPLSIKSEMTSIEDFILELYKPALESSLDEAIKETIRQQMELLIKNNSGYLLQRDSSQGEVVNHMKLSKSGGSDFEFDWSSRVNEAPSD